jgi:hypothetical protein
MWQGWVRLPSTEHIIEPINKGIQRLASGSQGFWPSAYPEPGRQRAPILISSLCYPNGKAVATLIDGGFVLSAKDAKSL